ncbi:MAG: aspartate-semialdehyde dehydrogenase [Spirochaetales bacterium]|nr:aspartate-semialdehyde dehydrogenase [Spirochaetales bacterium]
MQKIKIGILGATGIVGQNYIRLLQDHPWFEIIDVAASPRSKGKKYSEAVKDKWAQPIMIPEVLSDLVVRDVSDIDKINKEVKFVFSAMDLPNKEDTRNVEFKYAERGIPVVSNSSANRWTADVPMLIPEINHDHINIIPVQQKNRGITNGGFVAVKPNCSLQSYMTPVYALMKAGYDVESCIITTLQAISGAGYPGVPSLDMIDNIVPYIGGEEKKSEEEPLKILGKAGSSGIENYSGIKISATCTRVPVTDGHMACVSLKFKNKVPSIDKIKAIWKSFKSVPQELNLPFAPAAPIIYMENENRPQPKKDRNNEKGMAITVGRLHEDHIFDIKFVALSHNTIRGAAGGGILNAELLVARGFIK